MYSFELLKNLADFFVVNVSSPNTPNLRQLQDKAALAEILSALQEANDIRRPILVKVAPDLGFGALDEILELVEPHHLAGLVATNTTTERPSENGLYAETGGLSGRPLARRSTESFTKMFMSVILWTQTKTKTTTMIKNTNTNIQMQFVSVEKNINIKEDQHQF